MGMPFARVATGLQLRARSVARCQHLLAQVSRVSQESYCSRRGQQIEQQRMARPAVPGINAVSGLDDSAELGTDALESAMEMS